MNISSRNPIMFKKAILKMRKRCHWACEIEIGVNQTGRYLREISRAFPNDVVRSEGPNRNLRCKCTTAQWMVPKFERFTFLMLLATDFRLLCKVSIIQIMKYYVTEYYFIQDHKPRCKRMRLFGCLQFFFRFCLIRNLLIIPRPIT